RLWCAARCRRFGVACDEPQFLPFGRSENLQSAPGSAGAPATHLNDAIDCFVVAERIMVGESQSLGARGDRVVDGPFRWRVTPARLLLILRNRVLRIVYDEVRVRKEIDVTLVLLVPRWLTLGSRSGIRGMRLVIHRIHNRIAAGLQAIAQRESRVIEI